MQNTNTIYAFTLVYHTHMYGVHCSGKWVETAW